MKQEHAAVDDRGGDAIVAGIDDERWTVSLSQAGDGGQGAGQNCTGLEPRIVNEGFVLRDQIARHGYGENLDRVAGGGHDLIADRRVLYLERHKLLEPEADYGKRFGRLCGQSVKVEEQDTGRAVGHDEGKVAAALEDSLNCLAESGDHRGTLGPESVAAWNFADSDQGKNSIAEIAAGDRGEQVRGLVRSSGDDALGAKLTGQPWPCS